MERLFLIAVGSVLVIAVGSIVIPRLCERYDFGTMIKSLVRRLLVGRW